MIKNIDLKDVIELRKASLISYSEARELLNHLSNLGLKPE